MHQRSAEKTIDVSKCRFRPGLHGWDERRLDEGIAEPGDQDDKAKADWVDYGVILEIEVRGLLEDIEDEDDGCYLTNVDGVGNLTKKRDSGAEKKGIAFPG